VVEERQTTAVLPPDPLFDRRLHKAKEITADAPSEAELHLELWGHSRFHAKRLAALDPSAKKKDKSMGTC
jgi:hypothetical protein